MGVSFSQALRFERNQTTAFVGAGGKTTALFQLARELHPPVVVTTTTHLGEWQAPLADHHTILRSASDLVELRPAGLELVTGPLGDDGRFSGVAEELLVRLHDMTASQGTPLLLEADGGRERPLKAPGAHEPAIPAMTDLVVLLAGLDGLGKPLTTDIVHRPEIFGELSGIKPGELVSAAALMRVLSHPQGGVKNIPMRSRRIVVLNQADTGAQQAQARGMAPGLLGSFDAVLIASLKAGTIHAVHERVAGIVLAAGGSSRLGRPKALLDWHGQPFVRAVVRTALAAGLDPVVVVTGAHADEVEGALEGLPVSIAGNADWQSGQAGSIAAGLRALPAQTGAAIFLLADQPQVTFDVLAALVDAHTLSLQPIVAPLVLMERRANPVLFDRLTFPDLIALKGDVGGRAIFDKHRVEFLPWHDDRLLLDVDTEADYKRLLEDDSL